MISWKAAATDAALLLADPALTTRTGADPGLPVFRNRDFPLSPLPLLIDAEQVTPVVRRLEEYVELLEKVVRLHRAEPRVRDYYGLRGDAAILADADSGGSRAVRVCRLDGYLEQGSEKLRILENNADAPAGTLFTPRLNRAVDGIADSLALGYRAQLTEPAFASGQEFPDLLLGYLPRPTGPGPVRVCVLQIEGRANRESAELVAQLRTRGVDAWLADPRALRFRDGAVEVGRGVPDLCWNKINNAAWQDLLDADPELAPRWAAAVGRCGLLHVNPFSARYVAENKLTMALPQEPALADLFTPAERELSRELAPWSRRLSPTALAERPGGEGGGEREGGEVTLREELLARQNSYVLKEQYDIRGDGVTIGHAVDRRTWEEAVERGCAEHHLVQRYVRPTSYPVLREDGTGLVPMPVSLDTFVFDGRVVGFGSKASLNAKVNVFAGGQKLAVRVLGEARSTPAGPTPSAPAPSGRTPSGPTSGEQA